jgi:hypothetical protein
MSVYICETRNSLTNLRTTTGKDKDMVRMHFQMSILICYISFCNLWMFCGNYTMIFQQKTKCFKLAVTMMQYGSSTTAVFHS